MGNRALQKLLVDFGQADLAGICARFSRLQSLDPEHTVTAVPDPCALRCNDMHCSIERYGEDTVER